MRRITSPSLLVLPLSAGLSCANPHAHNAQHGHAEPHPQQTHAEPHPQHAFPGAADPAGAHGHGHGHGHVSGGMPHRFEDANGWAKVFDDPARDAWQRPAQVVALLQIAPGMTVADIGAGTGYFLPYLSRAVGPTGKVLGLDVEADMVRYMKERATREGLSNIAAAQVATDDPGLPAGGVDRVLIVDTWHHIDAREAYVKKLAAGLRPGGFVAVVDFTMESDKGPPQKHRIPSDVVMKELASGGLVPRTVQETMPDQYLVIGERPATP